jgi:hypothetical protein
MKTEIVEAKKDYGLGPGAEEFSLEMRKEFRMTNRIVVSMIRQEILEGKLHPA